MHRYLAFPTPVALLLVGLTVHNFHLSSEGGGGVSPILHVIHLQLSRIYQLFLCAHIFDTLGRFSTATSRLMNLSDLSVAEIAKNGNGF